MTPFLWALSCKLRETTTALTTRNHWSSEPQNLRTFTRHTNTTTKKATSRLLNFVAKKKWNFLRTKTSVQVPHTQTQNTQNTQNTQTQKEKKSKKHGLHGRTHLRGTARRVFRTTYQQQQLIMITVVFWEMKNEMVHTPGEREKETQRRNRQPKTKTLKVLEPYLKPLTLITLT